MPYTYQSVIDRLTTTVMRDDLLQQYLEFVNRAIHDIALRHSFNQMKAIGTGTINIGSTNVLLPADFKELQDGRYPIFDSVPNALVPVFVRSEVEKLLGNANALGLLPVNSLIYSQDFTGGTAKYNLDLPQNATVVHNLKMQYFAFPPDATDPTTTTPLITYFFDLVFLKAASIAFESISDPIFKIFEDKFLEMFQIQTRQDYVNEEPGITGQDP